MSFKIKCQCALFHGWPLQKERKKKVNFRIIKSFCWGLAVQIPFHSCLISTDINVLKQIFSSDDVVMSLIKVYAALKCLVTSFLTKNINTFLNSIDSLLQNKFPTTAINCHENIHMWINRKWCQSGRICIWTVLLQQQKQTTIRDLEVGVQTTLMMMSPHSK